MGVDPLDLPLKGALFGKETQLGTPLLTRGDIFDIINVIREAALRACRRSTKSILVAKEQHGRCDLTRPVPYCGTCFY